MGNPCPVVDDGTGTIWLPFTRDNHHVFVTSSRDDGVTWTAPRDIEEIAFARFNLEWLTDGSDRLR